MWIFINEIDDVNWITDNGEGPSMQMSMLMRLTSFLHEIEEFVEEGLAAGVVVQLVQLQQSNFEFN